MRRGLVAVGGRTGAGAGLRMLAGTVIALRRDRRGGRARQQARQPRLGRRARPAARLCLRHPLSPTGAAGAAAPGPRAGTDGRRRAAARGLGALVRRPHRAWPWRDPDLRRGGGEHEPVDERTCGRARGLAGGRRRGARDRGPHAGLGRASWWIAAPRPAAGCRPAWGSRPRAWAAWAGSIRSAVVVGERTWPGVGVSRRRAGGRLPGRAVRRLEARAARTSSRWPAARAARWRAPRICSTSLPWQGAGRRGGPVPGDRQDPPAGDRREGGTALRGPGVRGHVPDRAHRLGLRLGADLGAGGRDRAAQAARARGRPGTGAQRLGLLPDRTGGQGRSRPRSGAPTTRCCTAAPCTCGSRATDDEVADLAGRLPSSASDAFGTPFGELLEAADWNFYDIDPLLFSPAAVTLTSTESGRAHHGGGLAPDVLERSFAAVSERLRVGVLGASGSWHTRGLLGALAARGHEVVAIPATRLQSEVDDHGDVRVLGPDGVVLDALELLHRPRPPARLAGAGDLPDGRAARARRAGRALASTVRARSSARSTSRGPARCSRGAGVPTPPTIVCERYDGAMQAFERLGGDVVVKPLFGAMGNGIVRVEDRDVAHRVFRALELERTVYYVQRTIAPAGRRDLRVLVVAGEVAGAMERVTDSWRANIARGARPRAVALGEAEREAGARRRGRARGRRRRRRPARHARRGDVRARGQRDTRLAGAAVGLRARTSPRGWRAPARRWSRRDAALVQGGGDQRAGGAGGLERAQVVVVAHATAGVDRDPREGRGELDRRRPAAVRSRCPTRARSITSTSRTPSARASGAAAAASRPASSGSGRDQPSVAQVDAQHHAAGRRRGRSRRARATRCRRRCAPRRREPARRPARASWRRRRPRSPRPSTATRSSATSAGAPAIASRSATYSVPASARVAQRPRYRHRLAPVDQRAAQRRVLGALPAASVHDDAALEIEDRHDPHRPRMLPGIRGHTTR